MVTVECIRMMRTIKRIVNRIFIRNVRIFSVIEDNEEVTVILPTICIVNQDKSFSTILYVIQKYIPIGHTSTVLFVLVFFLVFENVYLRKDNSIMFDIFVRRSEWVLYCL